MKQNLTRDAAVAQMEAIETRMTELTEKHRMSKADAVEFDELSDEFRRLENHIERDDARARIQAVASGSRGGGLKLERGSAGDDYDRDPLADPHSAESRTRYRDPWALGEVRTFDRDPHEVAAEFRGRALSAIEMMPGASDRVRAAATKIIEEHDDNRGSLARHAVILSSPAYLRAWSKMARNEQHLLSPDEARAVSEVRAMSLTDNAGGYLVPFQLDPAVIITSNGSRNDIRQYARTVVATGDVWHGVSAGAVQWSWDGEATEVSDDSPTFGQPTIRNHKAQGFVPISIEAFEDAANVTQEIGKLLAFGKDDLEAAAFILGAGDGSNQPKGLITALDGTSAEMSPTTPETFSLADLYAVQGALPARFRSNAAWLANNLIYNRTRQFDTAGGAGLWEYLGGDRPRQLLGRPVAEAEAMDGTWNAAATADNFVLAFGDFDNYVITDRLGMRVEFIPHLFGNNNRPTGQRGWYAYYRVGADVVNPAAFKLLNIATAA